MNWKTTLLLVLVLASLAGVVLWQQSQEAADVHLVDERIFPDVDVERVTEIRIDNIYRQHSLTLRRDGQGTWFLTDPIAYPADRALVETLLADVGSGRLMVVGESEADADALGFSPPRMVMDVVETLPEGERKHRIEIGAPDLDGLRVHLRRDGRYYRTLRRIYTTLNRGIDEFRSQRILNLVGRDIVEVHRTGSVQYELDETPEDMAVSAYLDGGVWRSLTPFEARLDPMDVGVLVYGIARLEIRGFVEDDASDLSRYGLDQPLVRLSLGLSDGTEESLFVSRVGNTGRWHVKREHAPHVWSLEEAAVLRLFYPFEAMLEGHFMNARRGDVNALLIEGPQGELRLERTQRDWMLSSRTLGGEWSSPLRADSRVVDDWLGKLETLEVEKFDLAGARSVQPGELAIHVETPSGMQGGRFGGERENAAGETRLVYSRDGDEVDGMVPLWPGELARSTRLDFLSLELLALEEVQQVGLELKRGEATLEYTRDGRGLWHAAGSESEARELLGLLDPLLFLRAEQHLTRDEALAESALADAIEVSFVAADGSRVSFAVGLGVDEQGAARTELAIGGGRALAKRQKLHGSLLALFDA